MAQADLKIVVGADVKDALTGISSLKSALGDLVKGLAAGGIASAVAVGIGFAVEKLFEMSEAAKRAAEAQKELQKTIADASKEAAQQAEKITTLVDALQSGTLNSKQRKAALDELKKQNEDYFGALRQEHGLVIGLSAAYDNYIKHLNDVATAKSIENQLTKLFDKKLQLELTIDPKFQTVTNPDVQAQIGRLKKELNDLGGPVTQNQNLLKINDTIRKRIGLQQQLVELENGLRIAPSREVQQTQKQIDQINLQIQGLAEFQRSLGNFNSKPEITRSPSSLKDTTLADQEWLRKQLEKLTNAQLHIQVPISPDLVVVSDEAERAVKDFYEDSGKTLDQRIGKLPPLKTDIRIQPDLFIDNINKLGEKLDSIVKETLTESLTTIIADLGSGKFNQIFSDLFLIIGSGLQQLGKELIIASGIIKSALSALAYAIYDPTLLAIVGGVAVAAGAAIKSISSKKGFTAFAEGGMVTGPTLALLGEAGQNEYVVPADRMNSIINGMMPSQALQPGDILATLRGPDIVLAYNRQETLNRQNR